MKHLFAICMLVASSFVWAADNTNAGGTPGAITVTGKVLEVINVEHFTYLKLDTADGQAWAAVLEAKVKKGDKVTIHNAIVMQNFHSKSLKRDFKHILLGSLGGAGKASAASAPDLGNSFKIAPAAQPTKIEPVAKASGPDAMTVGEIAAKRLALKGKTVAVRGRVVKFNANIMNRNWVHLRDGTGSAADGSDDLLVTTDDTAKVGDVVTARGTVNTDQDFGAGYAYKVLVEKAKLQK